MKPYVKDFELEILVWFFNFWVTFHEFFILNVVLPKLLNIYLRIDLTNTFQKSNIFFFDTEISHDFWCWYVSVDGDLSRSVSEIEFGLSFIKAGGGFKNSFNAKLGNRRFNDARVARPIVYLGYFFQVIEVISSI